MRARCAGLRAVSAEPLPKVTADRRRLNQALANLFTNALYHTPSVGNVQVRCSTSPTAAPASDTFDDTSQAPAYETIAVTDTGEGIAPKDLPYLFERFHRADRSRNRDTGGRGLGLAIVKQIIEQHGGRVWVEGQPGQGSMFGFSLLIAQPT